MEIFLSKQCESFTGSLGKGFGYYIRRAPHKDGSVRFFSQQSRRSPIPRDGHLRFIFACAQLAQNKLHIADIRVTRKELSDALWEAGRKQVSYVFVPVDDLSDILSAVDVLNLKEKFNL